MECSTYEVGGVYVVLLVGVQFSLIACGKNLSHNLLVRVLLMVTVKAVHGSSGWSL